MSKFTNIYNEAAERRQQSLAFVGQDRRQIMLDAETQAAQEANNKAFLEGLQDIKDIKRIA